MVLVLCQLSQDYSEIAVAYRPSHADATYDFKYGVRAIQVCSERCISCRHLLAKRCVRTCTIAVCFGSSTRSPSFILF